MNVLIIDNYDSFTFNLYQLAGEITGAAPTVVHNDSNGWEDLVQRDFDCLIISPGPGRPDRELDFGLSRRAILELDVPVLGVCLGHQGICTAFGGSVVHAPEPMHGRLSSVHHDGSALFANIPNPFPAVRYHSLACARPLPAPLSATAWTEDGVVMGLAHRSRPIWGVQFHPESIATEQGRRILANFFELVREFQASHPRATRPAAVRAQPCAPAHGSGRGQHRLFVRKLTGNIDAAEAFGLLFAPYENAFWLDSSLVSGQRARFSFMGAASHADAEIVRCYAADRKLVVQRGGIVETSSEDLLTYLKRKLCERRLPATDLPFDFNCGYVGYLGYELKSLCGAPAAHRANGPDSVLLFVDRCLAIDHESNSVYLLYLGQPADAGLAGDWFDCAASRLEAKCPVTKSRWPDGNIHFLLDRPRDAYVNDIARCLEHIRNGESYEVCLTNQLRARATGDSFAFYKVLRGLNPAPYSAYLKFPGVAIACSSPERFLKVRPDGTVESRPIKGTIRRGRDAAEDGCLRQRLGQDTKTRAENLMIVDLLRNDLGRVCELGSVTVPELMKVESYATVHQLVSTIAGQLRADRTAIDCFRAAFPGGSMTGAPKLRTMAIIDDLEREARGVYSGSIGYFALNGAADLNIVIRTAVFRDQMVTIGVGGAVVAMSDPGEEWCEVLLKAKALLAAFESLAPTTTEFRVR